MSKDIKQFIHYYLGCEGVGDFGNVVLTPSWLQCVLSGIRKFRPILRPLSDMTEEEASYIFNIEGVKLVQFYKNDMCITFDHFGNEKHTWIKFDRLSPQQIVKLCKAEFDIFGLIESGLAISKTKQGI